LPTLWCQASGRFLGWPACSGAHRGFQARQIDGGSDSGKLDLIAHDDQPNDRTLPGHSQTQHLLIPALPRSTIVRRGSSLRCGSRRSPPIDVAFCVGLSGLPSLRMPRSQRAEYATLVVMNETGAARSSINELIKLCLDSEKLKQIERDNPLAIDDRRERVGEHCWHLAFATLVFQEHCAFEIDVGRATCLATVHDFPELFVGDTPVWSPAESTRVVREGVQ
jgi:hypothetical protein